jgi:hypothetical protein
MEERQIAEQKEKEKREELVRFSLAVTKIQALYRGWAIRRALQRAKVNF